MLLSDSFTSGSFIAGLADRDLLSLLSDWVRSLVSVFVSDFVRSLVSGFAREALLLSTLTTVGAGFDLTAGPLPRLISAPVFGFELDAGDRDREVVGVDLSPVGLDDLSLAGFLCPPFSFFALPTEVEMQAAA